MRKSRLITPRLTLGLPLSEAQRSGPITAEVGGSSPPRPTKSDFSDYSNRFGHKLHVAHQSLRMFEIVG